MALEEFLADGKWWDVEITDGPNEVAIFRYMMQLLDEGKRDSEPEFDVSVEDFSDFTTIDGLQLGPAYKESHSLQRPVVYLRGELEIAPSSLLVFPTVEGLYDIRGKSGGLLLVEKSKVSTTSPFRFK